MIGQMRAREFDWVQDKSGAIDRRAWESYRSVIYFMLGTERARNLWALSRSYFSVGFVQMVSDMMEVVPPTDYWDELANID
jgi:hypothetical protein